MADSLKIRPTVLLALRDHRTFLDHYFNQGGVGGVFVPGYTRLPSATEVDLEIAFAKEQVTMHARGVIKWKRLAGKKDMPPGIGIELDAAGRFTRDLLLDFANGKHVRLTKRSSRRYAVMVEVEYATDSVCVSGFTGDLSRDGAFVLAPNLSESVAVGTLVRLRIRPPGDKDPIELVGEVRWRQSDGQRGFGARFLSASPDAWRRLQGVIDKARQQIATELTPTGTARPEVARRPASP